MAGQLIRGGNDQATFVMVTGAAPGLGKSTLTRGLGDRLAASGFEVVVLLEAMIGERNEFADVMSSFRLRGKVSRAVLLEATERFADTFRDQAVVVAQDMFLPYLPSLFAWGYSDAEILELFADITDACSGVRLVQIHLDGSPALSVPRAIEREDPQWLDWMIAKVAGYADVTVPVTDLASLVEYFDEARRRARRLLAEAPWPVVTVDADLGTAQALEDAVRALTA